MTSKRRVRNQLHRRHIVRRGLVYSLGLVALILLIGGVGFWSLDPKVETLQDGLWLAFTTAATVGYGDLVPSTHASRAFAVAVVLLGLAVLSLVTASLAAIFVEHEVEEEEHVIEHDLMRELAAMRRDLASLRAEVLELHTQASTSDLLRSDSRTPGPAGNDGLGPPPQ